MFTAAGKSAAVSAANYIEDVFSTYLYTGTGASQTITNNIDTTTYGGLVWIKGRSGATGHRLTDTVRGATKSLASNDAAAEVTESTGLTAFGTTGFTIGADADYNTNAATYVSWAFRKQAKFFDVVMWTGNGTGNRTIPHALGSTPGFIQTKRTNGVENWWNHHRSVTSPNANWWRNYASLNATNAFSDWGDNSGLYQSPDANNLYIGSYYNASGNTYVAYLFAHDAGGFGATGTDNVISCGSYTGNGSATGPTITLGYEPQWLLIKRATGGTNSWYINDSIRGVSYGGSQDLYPNLSNAESGPNVGVVPTATGFDVIGSSPGFNATSETYIYIAIRRGPMKTPTSGTSVFNTLLWTGNNSTQNVTGLNFPPDFLLGTPRNFNYGYAYDKLRGFNRFLRANATQADSNTSAGQDITGWLQNGFALGTPMNTALNNNATTEVMWNFGRAPGFFDVVCYTGTGSNDNKNHNLAVVPELIILKARSSAIAWYVMGDAVLGGAGRYLSLNTTAAYGTGATHLDWTSTTFSVGSLSDFNGSGTTYVSYLFASLAGVSKVGSYTGTGALQTINCGFASGARFVLIKRTDSTGDWWVYDSARGITSGNDPYLLLNSTAAEVTNTNYVDTTSVGFQVTAAAPAGLNANGGTYIFLAIA